MARRKGRSVRNARKTLGKTEGEEITKAPHSFVIFRGKIGKNVRELMHNFRKVMEPYTASNLKIRKGNVVKDYVSVAGLLNVSHLIVFSKSEVGIYMRIIRLPRGPTVTFKINEYSLVRDVMSSIKRHVNYAKQFEHHPLLVLNNFSGQGQQFKLMSSMFQNMFPSININNVKLNAIRRCVLLNYNSQTKNIEFRHYTIKVVPTGVSRNVKKIVQSKIPDLGKFDDVSEYFMQGNVSESEAEPDGPENEVTLAQNISSRGNIAAEKSAIRLVELGPRITFQLIKIEEGVMEGEVMYHKLVQKTEEEVEELKNRQHKKKREKEQRRQVQEINKRNKEMEQVKHKQKSLEGMKAKNNQTKNDSDSDGDQKNRPTQKKVSFANNSKRKAANDGSSVPTKRQKQGSFDNDRGKRAKPFENKGKRTKPFENKDKRSKPFEKRGGRPKPFVANSKTNRKPFKKSVNKKSRR